ncbi:hypothetical protein D9M68_928870 [compost metagenome]
MAATQGLADRFQFRTDLGGDLRQREGGKGNRHQLPVVHQVLLLLGIGLRGSQPQALLDELDLNQRIDGVIAGGLLLLLRVA